MDVQTHSGFLLQQLQEQRIQGLLCDCTLVVKGVCFKAHKNVLAAFSAFFRSLFQTQKSDVFNLVIQDVSGIGQLLDYMYTSRLDLNPENVLALLEVAQCLQMPAVQGMCQSFLKPCPPVCPVGGALVPEHDCSLPHDADVSDPTRAPNESVHSSGPQPRALALSGESPPLHGYKLRNYYSRQYFKQIHGSAQDPPPTANPTANLPHMPTPTANLPHMPTPTPTANPTANLPHMPTPTPTVNMLSTTSLLPSPNPDLASPELYSDQTLNPAPASSLNVWVHATPPLAPSAPPLAPVTPPLAPVTPPLAPTALPLVPSAPPSSLLRDLRASELSQTVRPKKTVYLKKYDYLRSQKTAGSTQCPTLTTAQGPTAPPAAEVDIHQEPRTEPESGNPTHNPDPDPLGNATITSDSEPLDNLTPNPDPPEDPEPAPVLPPSGPRQNCCSDCGKVFKHRSNLELHKRSHTGEKPFQCNVCGRFFSQAGNLQTHLRRHSGEKPYICELCGKGFTSSGDVQRHKVVHTGERPHLCDICGRGFNNSSNLKEHKHTHSTDLSFTCDQCGKSFNAPRKLLKHKSRHGGEKPHSCSTCGKSFVGSGDLRRHVRSHTGEKPYVCSECNRSFSRSALLRRHCELHCKGLPLPTGPQLDNQPQTLLTIPDTQPESPPSALPKATNKALGAKAFCTPQSPPGGQLEPTRPPQLLCEQSPQQNPLHDLNHNQSPGLQPLHPPQHRHSMGPGSSLTEESASLPGGRSGGQLMSSVSLWGLAMKTLQNDTD